MQNLYTFSEFVRKSLCITKPVELRVVTKFVGKDKDAAAFCDTRLRKGKIIKHVIVFSMKRMESSEYNYYSVIAHELIHASMIENGLFDNEFHHDKMFQKLSGILEQTLRDLKFDLGNTPIWNKETDTD